MNEPLWPYPGSRWWKFDFHTHTPASRDTYWARKSIDLSPDDWLLRYMAAEVDCVAVTDHNSGAWVDKLKAAYAKMKEQADAGQPPEGFRELTLFPGVEISGNGGIHVLAIFDPSVSETTITSLLGAIGFPDDLYGFTDSEDEAAVTRKSLVDVFEEVLRRKGIPIAAHADNSKGLLQCRKNSTGSVLDANTVRLALAVEGLLAVEWCDPTRHFPECVYQEESRFAKVLGSDCHSFQGSKVPGSCYTWVKMAQPSLEGLRLALLDGNGISIRRSDKGAFDPFKTPKHFVTAIEIVGARYMGDSQPERIELTPFYNALIGGRGTGKSTLVHALRLAFQRDGELKSLGESLEPSRQFESFRKVPKTRDDDGALQEDTEIRVELMRDEQLHRLRWQNPGSPRVVVEERDSNETWCESGSQAINPERFPIRLFSQGQIAALAGEGRQALLDVIDEAAQVRPLTQKFEEAKRTYSAQRARLREMEGRLAERSEVERKLGEVRKKLKAFAHVDHAEVLKAHARTQDQRRETAHLLKQMRALARRIEKISQDFILDSWPSGVFDDEIDADILKWRKKAGNAVQQARQTLEKTSSALTGSVRMLNQDPLFVAWRGRTDKIRRNFNYLAAQGATDPQAFGQLVQERQNLEAQLKHLDAIKAERNTLEEEITAQWQRIVQLREAITSARAEFVKKTLDGNPFVRIEVVPFGFDARVIERSLRDLLEVTDDRFANDILAIDAEGRPASGLAFEIAQADNRKAALDGIKEKLQTIADTFGGYFKNYLKKKLEKPEFADYIQCWFPEDDLRIEYSRRANGTDWTALSQGSQGQRSAALLAFLLAFGEEPLVLDQPEDDLDNHLIYDLIVRQIRESKLRRQLVIVTHNPNVVVNGDAELVHVLDFRSGQCRRVQCGALQEKSVRDEVCRVMEGGREAFERRWKRLGKEL